MLFNYCKIQVDILLTLFIINFDTRKARVLLRFQRVNDNLRSMGGDQFFASANFLSFQTISPFMNLLRNERLLKRSRFVFVRVITYFSGSLNGIK